MEPRHRGGQEARWLLRPGHAISGFSVDHISGAGCAFRSDFSFMPLPGAEPTSPPDGRAAFATPFSHTKEIAGPATTP